MMKTIADNSTLASAIMIVCAIFTYGGAVNLGWSGFTMAVPFMALWFLIARKSNKPLMIASAIIFMMILGFYGLKKTNNDIFYPANGMTITLNKDSCFNSYARKYEDNKSNYILISEFKNTDDCLNSHQSMPDVIKSKLVPAGTSYIISRTEVSHADMGEQFVAYATDTDGEVYISDPSLFNKDASTVLDISDLRRPYFYYPSVLMMWPLFPILIFSVFSR